MNQNLINIFCIIGLIFLFGLILAYIYTAIYYNSDNYENFTNRAGAVNMNMDNMSLHRKNKCYWPFYKMVLDWDGGILLCCEDWFKLSKKHINNTFNINTHTIEEIWNSDYLNEYRSYLKEGKRTKSICNKCNMHGEKIGKEYVEYFSASS